MLAAEEASGIEPEQRKSLSATFFIFAWVIEIAAASVGISIAINRLDGADGIVPALPFFAVAIMEMAKIPLCTVIYHTLHKRWRFAFTVGLALSMFITFMTFFIGFEQYQATTTKKIQPKVTQIENIRTKIKIAETNLSASQKSANKKSESTQQHKKELEIINSQYQEKIKSIKEHENSIKDKYKGSKEAVDLGVKNLQGDIASLQNQLKDKNKTETDSLKDLRKSAQKGAQQIRKNIVGSIKDLTTEKEKIRELAESEKKQIRSKAEIDYKECNLGCSSIHDQRKIDTSEVDARSTESINNIDKKIDLLRAEMKQPGVKNAKEQELNIRQSFQSQRESIKKQLAIKEAELVKKVAELSRLRGKMSQRDQDDLKELANERNLAAQEQQKQIGNENKQFKARTLQVIAAQNDSSKTRGSLQSFRNDLVEPCNEYNNMVADEQVYRLAMQVHGVDNACDLTQEQISFTQFLWFGSLALVTSALGTALAFAGLVIKYPPKLPNRGGNGGMVRGLFRRLNYALALLHRRLRKPKIKEIPVDRIVEKIVEVTKEVPVDKVVYRDVPREVVIKELVHVPLFTQDIKAVVKDD